MWYLKFVHHTAGEGRQLHLLFHSQVSREEERYSRKTRYSMENRPHQTLHLSSPFVVMNLLPVPLSLGDVEALQNIKPGSKGPVSMFRGEVIKLPVKVCLVNMAVVGGMSAEVYDTPFVHLLVCTAHISYIYTCTLPALWCHM